ncbi:MAG: Serine/threonine-protein kinase PknD [Rhodocyclaceae bacterium]|nr:Serine/threonine-protein kinase PknD [Rhodocyclaceae bacterium]
MGVVYEGHDPGIDRRVAIKTLKREHLERSEADDVLARFAREAQAAGRLNHPGIVAIYDYGEDQGVAYIAMEYVEGRSLKDVLDASERFSLPAIMRIMEQVLSALDYSHGRGVVHRDIKPANIILLADGSIKVTDFGVARIESSTLTQAGTVLGTPAYMSPEQFMGQTVDGRSDIFSAGAMCYQLLTGEKPFTGGLTTIMHRVLKEIPPPPSELNVQVPRFVDAVIARAMAKRPDERYQTAGEFREALLAGMRDAKGVAPGIASDEATVVAGGGAVTVALARDALCADPQPVDATMKIRASQPEPAPAPASGANTDALRAETAYPRRRPVVVAVAVVVLAGVVAWWVSGPTWKPNNSEEDIAAKQPEVAAPAGGLATSASGPGMAVVSVLGIADPSDPRFDQSPAALAAALREDVKRQLVEKALALYVEPDSLVRHYALLQSRLMDKGGDYVETLLDEGAPEIGKDGLAYMRARALVRVREVQKSLNQMSRDERIEFIRNNGDPRISVAIRARYEGGDSGTQHSPVAENLLKERIQSFGFRVWGEQEGGAQAADFAIDGQVQFRKLSARLPASGLIVEKIALTSWTLKCLDRKTGEEVYHSTSIPEKSTWNGEEQALQEIGRMVGEAFSRNFFLQHFNFASQKVRLKLAGLPGAWTPMLMRELGGLRNVLSSSVAGQDLIDVEISAGSVSVADAVQSRILLPVNRKLGQTCLSVSGANAQEVSVSLDPACTAMLGRLETTPPAALFGAPKPRLDAIVRNPETLRKLQI